MLKTIQIVDYCTLRNFIEPRFQTVAATPGTEVSEGLAKSAERCLNAFNEDGIHCYLKTKETNARYYATGETASLASMPKDYRNLLLKDYVEYDLSNAAYNIARDLCHIYDIPCEQIEHYIANRDTITGGSQAVKKKYLSFLTGGRSYRNEYMESLKLKNKNVYHLGGEIDALTQVLASSDEFAELYDFTKKEKKANPSGCFMARVLQRCERQIIDKAIQHLIIENPGYFGDRSDELFEMVYIYDALYLRTANIGEDAKKIQKLLNSADYDGFKPIFKVNKVKPVLKLKLNKYEYNVQPLRDFIAKHSGYGICSLLENQHSTEVVIAENLAYELDGNVICSKNEWYVFASEHGVTRWRKATSKLVKEIVKTTFKMYGKKLEKILAEVVTNKEEVTTAKRIYNDICKVAGSTRGINNIIVLLKGQLEKNVEFDLQRHLIGFENGVYDSSTNEFRQYTKDDLVTMSTGIVYIEPEEDDEELELFFKQLTGGNEEHLRMLLHYYASCFQAERDSSFLVFQGNGSNGKSALNGLMSHCFGEYAISNAKHALITEQASSSTGRSNVDQALLSKKRLVIMSEPGQRNQINVATLKAITGNDTLSARLNNSNDNTVHLLCLFIFETNFLLSLSEEPKQAMIRRLKHVNIFNSSFVMKGSGTKIDHKKRIYQATDCTTPTWRRKVACYVWKKLFEASAEFVSIDDATVQEVKDASKLYLSNNTTIAKTFNENYVKSENAKPIPLGDIYKKIEEVLRVEQKNLPEKTSMEKIVKEINKLLRSSIQGSKNHKKLIGYSPIDEAVPSKCLLKDEETSDEETSEEDED